MKQHKKKLLSIMFLVTKLKKTKKYTYAWFNCQTRVKLVT